MLKSQNIALCIQQALLLYQTEYMVLYVKTSWFKIASNVNITIKFLKQTFVIALDLKCGESITQS